MFGSDSEVSEPEQKLGITTLEDDNYDGLTRLDNSFNYDMMLPIDLPLQQTAVKYKNSLWCPQEEDKQGLDSLITVARPQ
jgi:hypothetical protein